MSNAKQLFNRILVNNVEINIDELDANNGQYQLPSGETQAIVKFELKDKTTIPTNVFNNNPQVKSVKLASTIETIENGAFDGTSLDEASIEAITYINPIAYITSNRYTLEEAYAYNIQLPEAWKYGRVKIAAQPAVLEVLYTNDEVNTHNLTIPGAVNVGDLKPVEETPNTGTLDVDYQVGYKYTLPLMYTERSGQNRVQEIGTTKVQIVEIDDNEESTSQYKLKIKVIEVNITNPLTGVNIDYESEILNKYFYTQETFITANIDMFISLPGFTGVESFFAMKGSGDTYHPELENTSGVTDYSIKRNTVELTPETN